MVWIMAKRRSANRAENMDNSPLERTADQWALLPSVAATRKTWTNNAMQILLCLNLVHHIKIQFCQLLSAVRNVQWVTWILVFSDFQLNPNLKFYTMQAELAEKYIWVEFTNENTVKIIVFYSAHQY